MSQLSQTQRDAITEFPLNESIRNTRELFQAAEDSAKPNSVFEQLVLALISQPVASRLTYEPEDRSFAFGLAELLGRTNNWDRCNDNFRILRRLVVEEASDIAIWSAVQDLITTSKRPGSIAASLDSTPFKRSTSSFQGSEQTRSHLQDGLFYEIQHCTYRNVDGFMQKYFYNTKWSERVQDIYETVKPRHKEGHWVDFPSSPTQEDVWNWINRFQEDFLSDAPSAYHTSSSSRDLAGAEAKRQLDIFMKRRTDALNDKHDWSDICVIGEHKRSRSRLKPLLLQLCRYVRDIFTAQPTRRFVHGFFFHGTVMELWVFDRSGPYSSGEFDIHEQPEKFIYAIAGYAYMNSTELGLDTYIQSNQRGNFISIKPSKSRKKRNFYLESEPIVKQRAIVCRGTACYVSKDKRNVVKFSWTSDRRPPEAKYLKLARNARVKGVANLVEQQHITSIEKLRRGLDFPDQPYHFRELLRKGAPFRYPRSQSQSQLYTTLSHSNGPFQGLVISNVSLKRKSLADEEDREFASAKSKRQNSNIDHSTIARTTSLFAPRDGKFDNRLLRCIVVSPAGRPITAFSSLVELLTALRDAIRGHESLFSKRQLLHRDVSENNIIITEQTKSDDSVGRLIDLELVKEIGKGRSGARHQTGTMEFMAIEVLRKTAHTYRHDLESFLYVLLWICARRVWEIEFKCKLADRPDRDILRKWYTGSFDDIADAKVGYMHADGFKAILKQFPPTLDCLKPLCRKLRSILFPLTKSGELELGTPSDAARLYTDIEEAFNEAIDSVAIPENLR